MSGVRELRNFDSFGVFKPKIIIIIVRNFKNLKIWHRSRAFVKTIYDLSKSFPKEEQYGLIAQIRRATVSVPSNIAEG